MKLTKILLTLTLSLAAVACGGESRPDGTSGAAQENMQTPPPAADTSDSPDSCLSDNCSYEASRCDSDCKGLLECISGCDEDFGSNPPARDGCVDFCITVFGEQATQQLSSLLTCYEQACL